MNNRHLYVLTSLLILAGLALFSYKLLVLHFPLSPGSQVKIWDMEVRVSFLAEGKPVKVSLYVPRTSANYALLDENLVSRGYGMRIREVAGNRQVVWSIRKASGQQTLYYRATLQKLKSRDELAPAKPEPLQAGKSDLKGAHLMAAMAVVADIRKRSADTEMLVSELMMRLNAPKLHQNLDLLLGSAPTALTRARVATDILQLAGVQARIAHGVQLSEFQRDLGAVHWLQVLHGDHWRSYDLATGEAGVPDDYYLIWHGGKSLIKMRGGKQLQATISVVLNTTAALYGVPLQGKVVTPILHKFSLSSLPVDKQATYHVILLIPLGALLLVFLRNVIGIKTFGTFMPVLIALAFRETQLLWGLILFSFVIALGLSVRFYLDRLKLLLVPRLASVLIVVILLMAAISIISGNLGLERGLSIALFPMVIMTMTIERMSIVWEEHGRKEAMQQGLGSLAVAALAYMVMTNQLMSHLVFVFPELLLVVLALSLLLGRYSGYRLLELIRFRALLRGSS